MEGKDSMEGRGKVSTQVDLTREVLIKVDLIMEAKADLIISPTTTATTVTTAMVVIKASFREIKVTSGDLPTKEAWAGETMALNQCLSGIILSTSYSVQSTLMVGVSDASVAEWYIITVRQCHAEGVTVRIRFVTDATVQDSTTKITSHATNAKVENGTVNMAEEVQAAPVVD